MSLDFDPSLCISLYTRSTKKLVNTSEKAKAHWHRSTTHTPFSYYIIICFMMLDVIRALIAQMKAPAPEKIHSVQHARATQATNTNNKSITNNQRPVRVSSDHEQVSSALPRFVFILFKPLLAERRDEKKNNIHQCISLVARKRSTLSIKSRLVFVCLIVPKRARHNHKRF